MSVILISRGGYIKPLSVRFDEKWIPVTESGCWLWTGGLNGAGYGRLYFRRGSQRSIQAHRIGYELYRGKIPPGLVLDHLCKVICCVNPWHLEAVTNKENSRRAGSWDFWKSKTHCPYGHEYSPENTHHYRSGRYCRACWKRRDALKAAKRKAREQIP